jgi:hypothetical protein
MAQGVFVITEQRDGVFRKLSFEAVSEGRRIADGMGADLTAVVVGSGIEGMAGELEKYGPDKILTADDPALAEYTTDVYTNVIAGLIQSVDPAVILIGASVQGKDQSARLAARLCTRPMFGGKIFADVEIEGSLQIIAIRPNVMDIVETAKDCVVEKASVNVGEVKTAVVEKSLDTGDKIELTEADIIAAAVEPLEILVPLNSWRPHLAVLWGLRARRLMKAGARTVIRWGRPEKSFPPCCTLPAVFREPFSIWPACRLQNLSWPSTRILKHPFFQRRIWVLSATWRKWCRRWRKKSRKFGANPRAENA